ncbi:MAG: hypothetical protein LBQ98_04790, partial [Nitrososphaerota archaeon]|nr:hypothetical protein [Nitrososphaerota archaeon]
YAFVWTPDIAGAYQVTARFGGSDSYYPSDDTTYFYASDPATPVPTVDVPVDFVTTADLLTYLAVGVIAIILVVVVIGVLILRKK